MFVVLIYCCAGCCASTCKCRSFVCKVVRLSVVCTLSYFYLLMRDEFAIYVRDILKIMEEIMRFQKTRREIRERNQFNWKILVG